MSQSDSAGGSFASEVSCKIAFQSARISKSLFDSTSAGCATHFKEVRVVSGLSVRAGIVATFRHVTDRLFRIRGQETICPDGKGNFRPESPRPKKCPQTCFRQGSRGGETPEAVPYRRALVHSWGPQSCLTVSDHGQRPDSSSLDQQNPITSEDRHRPRTRPPSTAAPDRLSLAGREHQERKSQARRECEPWRRKLLMPAPFAEQERRRHRILDTFFKELEGQGARIGEERPRKLFALIYGEKIEFDLREKRRKIRRPLTEEERRWTSDKNRLKQELVPTGFLLFSIRPTSMPACARSGWRAPKCRCRSYSRR